MRLYDLIAHVEGQLAFEDPEALVLSVVAVSLKKKTIGGEYLYHRIAPAGLLPVSLHGGQQTDPPPRFAFARPQRKNPARGVFCVERDPRPGLVFCSRHSVFLLSLHNSVQGTMTEYGPSVKVECTNLCNNFFHATQIRDEAQGRAHAGDPPEDHPSHRGAAPERGPGADHRERHRREGWGTEAHLLRPLPRAKGPLPSLHGSLPGAKPPAGPIPLGGDLRLRGAPKEGAIRGLRLLRRQRGDVGQRAA